ncbi:hypothetical protein KC19_3G137100 [Ceratodon purpureus]|uniref:30S ribosomal protein S20 n=1 Tax=Ceratodon purpureus TaxID=3225 RepID=A0A8T0ILW7_CERPU|nr:hypothetical protein KC19_3G137100 [Ceratodon purpureus]
MKSLLQLQESRNLCKHWTNSSAPKRVAFRSSAAMAMALGSSCRAAVGPLCVAPGAPVCASQRSSVSLRSSFAGLRLQGVACSSSVVGPVTRRPVLVRAAAAAPTKKADQAAKRARQNEKRRVYHKSKKSEVSTRMKKVFVALDGLKKRTDATEEDFKPIETLIAEAFSIIDKAVKVGTLHQNKGGHQKSRLSRAKRTMLIQLGLYTPVAA